MDLTWFRPERPASDGIEVLRALDRAGLDKRRSTQVLRLEGVRWLPSTKRRLKWLFTESGAWQQPAMLDFTVPELETAAPGERPSAPERAPTPEQLAEGYAREVGRALDEWFD